MDQSGSFSGINENIDNGRSVGIKRDMIVPEGVHKKRYQIVSDDESDKSDNEENVSTQKRNSHHDSDEDISDSVMLQLLEKNKKIQREFAQNISVETNLPDVFDEDEEGWEIFYDINIDRVIEQSFPVENGSLEAKEQNIRLREGSRELFKTIIETLRKHYHYVDDGWQIKKKISVKKYVELQGNCSCLFGYIMVGKLTHLSRHVRHQMLQGQHLMALGPLNNRFNDLFYFNRFGVEPNPKYGVSDDHYFMKMSGFVLAPCEIVDSIGTTGTGANKRHFKVINLLNPAKKIFEQYFNRWVRKEFPKEFSELGVDMFISISTLKNKPVINALKGSRYNDGTKCLIMLNAVGIKISNYNNTPEIHFWPNLFFEKILKK